LKNYLCSSDFPPRKTLVAQKHGEISPQEKVAFSSPYRVALGLPSPSPESARTGVQAYADVRTKISRMDRLPDFLNHAVPLARSARGSSAISTFEINGEKYISLSK